jgi:5-methylcytosine-specific restriction enzyme MrcB-like protein
LIGPSADRFHRLIIFTSGNAANGSPNGRFRAVGVSERSIRPNNDPFGQLCAAVVRPPFSEVMRASSATPCTKLSTNEPAINLGSMDRLPGDYVAGHALGTSYALDALPDEATLRVDLQTVVRAYRALTYRGGADADVETQSEVADEFGLQKSATVVETRKYAYHRKVERSRTATKKAKEFHGTRCQACELSFPERYGGIGQGFIEAHHLKPISSLEEGVAVAYDVAADFAVLCSNCHRMIHRYADPSDLKSFRAIIQANKS